MEQSNAMYLQSKVNEMELGERVTDRKNIYIKKKEKRKRKITLKAKILSQQI